MLDVSDGTTNLSLFFSAPFLPHLSRHREHHRYQVAESITFCNTGEINGAFVSVGSRMPTGGEGGDVAVFDLEFRTMKG